MLMQRWCLSGLGRARGVEQRARCFRAVLASVLLVVATILPGGALPARADDFADLPDLGAVVVVDPLTASGALQVTACPAGRNSSDFTPEGFRMKVTGRCSDAPTSTPSLRAVVRGLTFADGDVA